MTWTLVFQLAFLVCLGAHIYSCGKASASLIAPINNLIERASEFVSRRADAKHSNGPVNITPNLRS
jgi:hypothetical protein